MLQYLQNFEKQRKRGVSSNELEREKKWIR